MLGDADLVSTISGTVASVSVAPDGSVSASSGSTSPAVVVIGSGTSYQAVAQVPVARIGTVSVGQRAVVTPDATNDALDGRVTSIGVLGTTESTTTTYPVTISLDSTELGRLSGAEAEVAIVTRTSSHDAVTVPSSAVRTVGSRHLVTTLAGNGTTNSVVVTLGTVGDVLTQVTSGLRKGEVVVLADYGSPVPSSSTTNGRFGLGGGVGGFGELGASAEQGDSACRGGPPSPRGADRGPRASRSGTGSALGARSHGSIVAMPLLVVRHAHAGRRSQYEGDDRERPLSARGRAQASALVELLRAYRPQAILSSPFVRCVETVRPLGDALDLPVETTDELAEVHEEEALELMGRLWGKTAVLCTHGDVAVAILEELEGRGDSTRERRLQKGEVWVIDSDDSSLRIADHLRQPAAPSGSSRRSPPPVR